MRVELAYGRTWLPVELPDGITDVVTPKFIEGVPNEEEALREALRNPIGSASCSRIGQTRRYSSYRILRWHKAHAQQ